MTRQELEKYVGKFCHINERGFSDRGFLIFSKVKDEYCILTLYSLNINAFVVYEYLYKSKRQIKDILNIKEVDNEYNSKTIHECFGHEIEDWISKPIESVSIDLNKYPHICNKCSSLAWINPVTNHTDCSNKNCKG